MIISHKYKFIFIKTNKTAGTSVEIALSKHCGPDDIITPITPEDEEIRQELGYRGPQNYLAPFEEYTPWDILRRLFARKRKLRFHNHISASLIKQRIGAEVFDSYYKFCIERNPWDRLVSLYYWHNKSGPLPDISTFVESKVPSVLKRKGFGLYTIDGQVVVDKICRFEKLADELEVVRKSLGIPETLELPRAKSRFRKDKRKYQDILGEKEKAKVAELFRDEIELLGYTF